MKKTIPYFPLFEAGNKAKSGLCRSRYDRIYTAQPCVFINQDKYANMMPINMKRMPHESIRPASLMI
ncbi:MAG: hypothetical protein LUQ69_10540 [Methanoregulaceae archaeon]|nr:hypothetical protein [Methanoregulaceae archaeon]